MPAIRAPAAMSYYMWTQHWPITELKQIDREARKIVAENGGKHPCGSTSLVYPCGRGLRSIETEYKETKVKAAVNLYQNRDPAMKMVRDFEERAESVGHQALTTEAACRRRSMVCSCRLNILIKSVSQRRNTWKKR